MNPLTSNGIDNMESQCVGPSGEQQHSLISSHRHVSLGLILVLESQAKHQSPSSNIALEHVRELRWQSVDQVCHYLVPVDVTDDIPICQ
jgi:hypothetical protein